MRTISGIVAAKRENAFLLHSEDGNGNSLGSNSSSQCDDESSPKITKNSECSLEFLMQDWVGGTIPAVLPTKKGESCVYVFQKRESERAAIVSPKFQPLFRLFAFSECNRKPGILILLLQKNECSNLKATFFLPWLPGEA